MSMVIVMKKAWHMLVLLGPTVSPVAMVKKYRSTWYPYKGGGLS